MSINGDDDRPKETAIAFQSVTFSDIKIAVSVGFWAVSEL